MVKPSSRYGDSFTRSNSPNIVDRTPVGIDPTHLSKNLADETVEFTELEDYIRDFALMRLGHPVVRVELTDSQLKSAMDEAIGTLYYHAPHFTMQTLTFTASGGINTYELPSWCVNSIEYVVYQKDLLTAPLQVGNESLESDIFLKYFQDNNIFRAMDMGHFYLIQQNLEMLRKILSREGSWDIIDNKYLRLSPTPVDNPEVIVIYRALNSETLHHYYLNWIQKFTLAVAKTILGQVRGKYRTLPSPGGGAQLDGDALRQEGEAEKVKLLQQLIDEIEEPLSFSTY